MSHSLTCSPLFLVPSLCLCVCVCVCSQERQSRQRIPSVSSTCCCPTFSRMRVRPFARWTRHVFSLLEMHVRRPSFRVQRKPRRSLCMCVRACAKKRDESLFTLFSRCFRLRTVGTKFICETNAKWVSEKDQQERVRGERSILDKKKRCVACVCEEERWNVVFWLELNLFVKPTRRRSEKDKQEKGE